MTCPISNQVLQIDEKNPNDDKTYSLKIFNYCGNEILNVEVSVKGSHAKDEGEKENEGSNTTLIVVIVVIVVIALAAVAFLVIRMKKKSTTDPSVEVPKSDKPFVEMTE